VFALSGAAVAWPAEAELARDMMDVNVTCVACGGGHGRAWNVDAEVVGGCVKGREEAWVWVCWWSLFLSTALVGVAVAIDCAMSAGKSPPGAWHHVPTHSSPVMLFPYRYPPHEPGEVALHVVVATKRLVPTP